MTFENLKLSWDGRLEFNNFYLEDHHNDTLLYVKVLETSLFDFKNLNKNNFKISELSAKGLFLNLKKYKGETTHSLKILIEKFKKDTINNQKVNFKIDNLNIEHGTFIYKDKVKTESKTVHLDSLNIFSKKLTFENNRLETVLENFEGQIHTPEVKPFKINALLKYKPGKLYLEDLKLVSENNSLNGSLELLGVNRSLKNFKSTGIIKMEVLESQWDINTLFPENINLESIPAFNASFIIQGGFSALKFNEIKVSNIFLDFKGNIITKNISDSNRQNIEIITNSLSIKTQGLQRLSFLSDKLKKQLNYISNINIEGISSISNDSIGFNFKSKNSWGNFSINGILGNGFIDKKKSDKMFSINTDFANLELSRWISKAFNFRLGGSILVKGDYSNKENPIFFWKVNNSTFSAEKFTLQDISMEGRFEQKQLRNTLSINSESIKLKSDALYNFNLKIPETTLLANIEKWDFNNIGLELGSGKKEFKGIISSNFKGTNVDDLEGNINISSASLENEIETVEFNPISVIRKSINNIQFLKIENTDCIAGDINGDFKISELGALFQSTFHQAYPFLPKKNVSKKQNINFKLIIREKLINALYPDFSISENITLTGVINSNKSSSKLALDTPLMLYKETQFEKLHFEIDTKNPLFNSYLSIKNISNEYYKGKDFNLISTKLRDTLFFRSEFQGANSSKSPFEVNFYHTTEKDGNSFFGIRKSTIPLGADIWTINPNDINNQKISYSPDSKEIVLNSVSASSGNQTLSAFGKYLNLDFFDLKLDIKNVLLENTLPTISTFGIAGQMDISANISRSSAKNQLNIETSVKELNINNQYLGDLRFAATGNTRLNTYIANLSLIEGKKIKLQAKGLWQGLVDSSLNFNLDLDDLDIAFLSPLGKKSLNNIHGIIGGSLTVLGTLNDIKHNGNLSLVNGGFSIPFLNLNYNIESTNVTLNDKSFIFNSSKIRDNTEGTYALLNGSFSHSNFSNWLANLTINSDRMLLLNTEQKPESLFFGQGYLGGTVHIEGPTKNLKISLQGNTEKGTYIKIPWAENYGLSDTSFLSFINKKGSYLSENKLKTNSLKDIKGLELDFELDVNNNAIVEIVIDKESGSYLSGRGAGNLLMEVNTKGKFNMWGDFITDNGIYNFKNLGLIDKKFNLKPGGSIVWEGNPLEAQMSLEAVYDVPGGANPALLLDNPNFNKNIPTEVLIRLQGNLLKPDDPIFEIDFPNTSGTVASEINYRLSDPQRSQMQALSLLSQGIFINEVSVSMQGITNNLYQKASDIVSNLISEDDDKLKVGIDYLQGDKSQLLDIATEDRLGFTLSTKISDKILLNGKIGVPIGGLEQTLIVGNVQIDFILNDEGSLRAKVFNKENEFRYIGDELGYTQGVGLSYDVDFNTFKDMIQKIVTNKRNLIEKGDSFIESEKDEIINFVKKN
ncbi:MAG: translocation/assembly module TamB domain-containing protein [Flavobacteriaceae bacterium]